MPQNSKAHSRSTYVSCKKTLRGLDCNICKKSKVEEECQPWGIGITISGKGSYPGKGPWDGVGVEALAPGLRTFLHVSMPASLPASHWVSPVRLCLEVQQLTALVWPWNRETAGTVRSEVMPPGQRQNQVVKGKGKVGETLPFDKGKSWELNVDLHWVSPQLERRWSHCLVASNISFIRTMCLMN